MKIDHRVMLAALLYRRKKGCSRRDPPKEFGHRHVIHMRFSPWAKNGVPERVYAALSEEGFQGADAYALDSTPVEAHPDAFGCLKRQTVDREVPRRAEHENSRDNGDRHAP